MAMFLLRSDQSELGGDADGFDGLKTNGDLIITGTNEGLTTAEFKNCRVRETLTLNTDGTMSVTTGDMYTKVTSGQ